MGNNSSRQRANTRQPNRPPHQPTATQQLPQQSPQQIPSPTNNGTPNNNRPTGYPPMQQQQPAAQQQQQHQQQLQQQGAYPAAQGPQQPLPYPHPAPVAQQHNPYQQQPQYPPAQHLQQQQQQQQQPHLVMGHYPFQPQYPPAQPFQPRGGQQLPPHHHHHQHQQQPGADGRPQPERKVYPYGVYVGTFQGRKKHGNGRLVTREGTTYSGEWVDDQMEGFGVYSWPDGRRYEGQMHRNRFCGNGEYTWPDGHRFVGCFEDDKLCEGEFFVYGFEDQAHKVQWHKVTPSTAKMLIDRAAREAGRRSMKFSTPTSGTTSPSLSPTVTTNGGGVGGTTPVAPVTPPPQQHPHPQQQGGMLFAQLLQQQQQQQQQSPLQHRRYDDPYAEANKTSAADRTAKAAASPTGGSPATQPTVGAGASASDAAATATGVGSSGPATVPDNNQGAGWSCALCTLINDKNAALCTACTAPKPSDSQALLLAYPSSPSMSSGQVPSEELPNDTGDDDDVLDNRSLTGACVVCMQRKRTSVVVPCGHLCLCDKCSTDPDKQAWRIYGCPVCRTAIRDVVKVVGM